MKKWKHNAPNNPAEIEHWADTTANKITALHIDATASLNIVRAPAETSPAWHRFLEAALVADFVCYSKSTDRAEYNRLSKVIQSFPQGFTVYFATCADDTTIPVGYTGWYPISENVFSILYHTPSNIKHRGFMQALPELSQHGNYIYLFNYSIIPSLRGTAQSKQLIKNYAADLKNIAVKGMGAVTVSPDGMRVAEKFGLSYRGDMTHDGVAEKVFAAYL